ncbi:MAG: T9SS type A sorting domain-containing protein [Crocinitomicaceae bacterium]|nr:T9SS type A sorting domain-containing protein [Crocinitomicaceae bacterium]
MEKLFLIILSLSFNQAFSQELKFEWAGATGSQFIDDGYSVAIDLESNSYFLGYFHDTVDIDPGPGVSTLVSNGSYDTYIVKLDSNGIFQWGKSFGGPANDWPRAIEFHNGFLYAIGWYKETVDFDLGPGTDLFYSVNSSADLYVLKLDLDGNTIWNKSIGGPEGDNGRSIVLDGANNIYVAGRFRDTVDFDPGLGVSQAYSSNFGAFLLKLNSTGEFEWVRDITGSSSVTGTAVEVDNLGNVYFGGTYYDSADFDPTLSTQYLNSLGSRDIFLQKYDTSGNYIWTKTFGGVFADDLASITTDLSGSLYLAGNFQGSMDLDPGVGIYNALTTGNGDRDIFIVKLTQTGDFVWGHDFGNVNTDWPFSVKTDQYGNVYTTGTFQGFVDFDPSPEFHSIVDQGGSDIYVNKLDSSGNFKWAVAVGGSSVDEGFSLEVSEYGEVFVTGHFWNSVDFDFGPNTSVLTSNGDRDSYFLKFSQCYFEDISLNQVELDTIYSECDLDSIPSPTANTTCGTLVYGTLDSTYSFVEGLYDVQWNFYNGFGNDTISQNQIVVIQYVNDSVYFDGTSLIALATGYQYQWYNCDSSAQIIGANSQTYVPIQNGSYFVEISNGQCSVTSDCLTIQNLGEIEIVGNEIQVFPNPFFQEIDLSFSRVNERRIYVLNSLGQTVYITKTNENFVSIDLSTLENGIYFVIVEDEEGRMGKKIIKTNP